MAFRLGGITVDDPLAGTLQLKGDGYAAAGEIPTLLVSPEVQDYMHMSALEWEQARRISDRYRDALRQVYATGAWSPPHLNPATRIARRQLAADLKQLIGAERAGLLQALSLRVRSADALLDEEAITQLAIGESQLADLTKVAAMNEVENREALKEITDARLRDRSILVARALQLEEVGRRRMLGLLSAEQRRAFDALVGTATMLRPES